MRLDEIGGETGWIERLRTARGGAAGGSLVVPIGDDAAVLDVAAGQQVVVTTDMLVETVHFRRDWSDPYAIGWKAAAVNVSDIAAMGAEPSFAFVSLACARDETLEALEQLYDGLTGCLAQYGARLAGGDTNFSPHGLTINITLLGTVPAGRAWTRDAARVGDTILVTGTLGNSRAGLALLTEYGPTRAELLSPGAVSAHRCPQPRMAVARALAPLGIVRAAMDVSDGLVADLAKLCAASGVGAEIDAAAVPISDDLRAAAEALGTDPLPMALLGGEDLEILLVAAPQDAAPLQAIAEAAGTPCTRVGIITEAGVRFVGVGGGDALPPGARGWDHFTP